VLFTLFQQVAISPEARVDASTVVWLSIQLVGIILGSILLSGVICYSSAYLLRRSDPVLRQHPTYEISTLLLSAYASYLAAELVQLSGILAVFFSGVFIRHYHTHNVSKASAFAFTHLLSTIAFLAENFIFLYLGISVVSYWDDFRWNWQFILASFGAVLVARACSVFPLCFLANCWRSSHNKISARYMLVIWFSGLRGAVAFALALNATTPDPSHVALIRSSTIFSVLLTSAVFGMLIDPLLEFLKIAPSPPRNERNSERVFRNDSIGDNYNNGGGNNGDAEDAGEERPLLRISTPPPLLMSPPGLRSVRAAWIALDEKYLKPVFGGRPRPTGDGPSMPWEGET
jgi:sodium/hydrogen exchanger 8